MKKYVMIMMSIFLQYILCTVPNAKSKLEYLLEENVVQIKMDKTFLLHDQL